jgi:hypothetical protein
MARSKPKDKAGGFTTFTVYYEDGTITSNRRVTNDRLVSSFGDPLPELARGARGAGQRDRSDVKPTPRQVYEDRRELAHPDD